MDVSTGITAFSTSSRCQAGEILEDASCSAYKFQASGDHTMAGAVAPIKVESTPDSPAEDLGLTRTSDDATVLGWQHISPSVAAPGSSNDALESGCSSEIPASFSLSLTVPSLNLPVADLVTKSEPMLDDSGSLGCDEHSAPAQCEHVVPETSEDNSDQDTAPSDEPSASPSPEACNVSGPSFVPPSAQATQLRLAYPLILRRLCMQGSGPQFTGAMYSCDTELTFPLNSNGTSPHPRQVAVLALPADPRFREVQPATSSSNYVPFSSSCQADVLSDPTTNFPSFSENSAASTSNTFPGQFYSHPTLPPPLKLRPGPSGTAISRFPLGLNGCSYSVIQPLPVSPLTSDALLISTHRQSDGSPGISRGSSNQAGVCATRACVDVSGRDPSTPILLDDDPSCTSAHSSRGLFLSRGHYQQSARHHPPSSLDRDMATLSMANGHYNWSPVSEGNSPVVLPDNRRISPSCIPPDKRPRYGRFRENRGCGPRPILPRPQCSGYTPGQSVGPHLIATIQTLEAQLQHADIELQRLKAVEEQYVRASSQRPLRTASSADFMLDTADVVLTGCDESRVYAHKAVLVGKSQVFKARFDHQNEEKTREVVLTNFSRQVLEAFVTFFYTATVDSRILEMHAGELLFASETYIVEHLKALCENAIIKAISQDNLLELFELACVSRSAILKEAVLDAVAPRGMAGICELGKYEVYAAKNPQLLLELYRVLGSYRSPHKSQPFSAC